MTPSSIRPNSSLWDREIEQRADVILLLSVALPPAALDVIGPTVMEKTVETAFGEVGPLGLRAVEGQPAVWVEPYSGGPGRTDPRATILAAAQLGVRQILAWDLVIALDPELRRGQVAVVSDYIDWSRRCTGTFTNEKTSMEQIAYLGNRPSFCPRIRKALSESLPEASDVNYLAVDGPRRETAAEARMFRAWGADVIGQNLSPEVALAQEAGFCYAGLVTIADLAADQAQPEPRGEVRASLGAALAALPQILEKISAPGVCECAATIG